jgi:catechol 2,3-dioxygenase-like lactoylglutathione lyase family enzyme
MAKAKKKPTRRVKKAPPKKKVLKPGFFHGLRTAVYFVDDLDKAKAWYADVLGHKPYFDSPYYVGFSVGGFELGLHPRDEKYPGLIGSTAAYWGVSDAMEAHARLLQLGATEYSRIEDVGEGIKIGAVKDPFGNLLGIIENPSFRAL